MCRIETLPPGNVLFVSDLSNTTRELREHTSKFETWVTVCKWLDKCKHRCNRDLPKKKNTSK